LSAGAIPVAQLTAVHTDSTRDENSPRPVTNTPNRATLHADSAIQA
jgi:hypothetical protein